MNFRMTSLGSLLIIALLFLQGCQFGFSFAPADVARKLPTEVTQKSPTNPGPLGAYNLYPEGEEKTLIQTLPLMVHRVSPQDGQLQLLNRSATALQLPTLHIHTSQGRVTRAPSTLEGLRPLALRVPMAKEADFVLIVAEREGQVYPVRYLEYGRSFQVSFRSLLWQGGPIPAARGSFVPAKADFRGFASSAADYTLATQPAPWRGRLQDLDGNSVANATIKARCHRDDAWGDAGVTKSAQDGTFQLSGRLDAAICWLSIGAKGILPSKRAFLTVSTSNTTTLSLVPAGRIPGKRVGDIVTFDNGVTLTAPATDLDKHGDLYFVQVPSHARSHLDLDPMNTVEGYAVHGQDPSLHVGFSRLAALRIPLPEAFRKQLPPGKTRVYMTKDAASDELTGLAFLNQSGLLMKVRHFSTQTINLTPNDFGALRFEILSKKGSRRVKIQPTCFCSNQTKKDECLFDAHEMKMTLNSSATLDASREFQSLLKANLSREGEQSVEAAIDKINAKSSGKSTAGLSTERKLQELIKLQLTEGRVVAIARSCGGGKRQASPCFSIQREVTIGTRTDTMVLQRYKAKFVKNLVKAALVNLVTPGLGLLLEGEGEWVNLKIQTFPALDTECSEIRDTYAAQEGCNCSKETVTSGDEKGLIKKLSSGPLPPAKANDKATCPGTFYVSASNKVVNNYTEAQAVMKEISTATANLVQTLAGKCSQECKQAGFHDDPPRECQGTLGTVGERRIEVELKFSQTPPYRKDQLLLKGQAPCYCGPKSVKEKPKKEEPKKESPKD